MVKNLTRKVEIFSAGCIVCKDAIELVERLSCSSCDVVVLDMNSPEVADRARDLGIKTVPAIVIDGQLADCCSNKGSDEETLRQAGIGQPLN